MSIAFNKRIRKPRIVEIDFIRGVLIWFMIVDHLFFDFWNVIPNLFTATNPAQILLINNLRNFGWWYWDWPLRIGTRYMILAVFFLISGICTYFSRNTLKRGIITFSVGVIISLLFYGFGRITNQTCYIFFGAITCFGVSIIIYWLLRTLFKKIFKNHPDDIKWIMLSLGALIVAIGMMFNCWTYNGPERVYNLNWDNFFLIIIGRYQDGGAMDWLPLFPYLGFMLIGTFLGETIYAKRQSYFKPLPNKDDMSDKTNKRVAYYGIIAPYKGFKNVLCFTGHYSLFFYVLHQVVLILLLVIIFLSMGFKLNLPF